MVKNLVGPGQTRQQAREHSARSTGERDKCSVTWWPYRGDFIQNDYAYTDENYDDDDASIQVEVATDENGSGWERRRTGIQRRARATTQSVILRRVRSKRNLQGSLLRHNNRRQQDKRESWHCTFEEGEYVEDEDGKTCCGVDVTLSDHLVSSATNNKPDNTATERQARKLEQNQ